MRVLHLWPVLFALLAGAPARAELPLGALPGEVVAVIEFSSPRSTDARLGRLGRDLRPGLTLRPPSVSARIAERLLRTKSPSTVDLQSPVRLFLLAGHSQPVVSFSAVDPMAYAATLFDDVALLGADGRPEREAALVLSVETGWVLLGPDASAVERIRALAPPPQQQQAPWWPGVDVGCFVRPAALLSHLRAAEQRHAEWIGHMPLFQSGRLLRAVLSEALDAFAREAQTAVATLSLGDDQISAELHLSFGPDGGAAAYLRGIAPGRVRVLRQLPRDAMCTLALKLGDTAPLVALIDALLERPEFRGVSGDALRSARDLLSVLEGGVGRSLVRRQDGALLDVRALRTRTGMAQQAGAALTRLTGDVLNMLTPGAEVRLEATRTAGTGSPTRYGIQIAESTRPMAAELAEMRERRLALLRTLWGPERSGYGIATDQGYVLALGPGARAELEQRMRREAPAASDSAPIAAAGGVFGQSILLGYIDMGACIDWYLELLRRTRPAGGLPVLLRELRFAETPAVIVAAERPQPASVSVRALLPVATARSLLRDALSGLAGW